MRLLYHTVTLLVITDGLAPVWPPPAASQMGSQLAATTLRWTCSAGCGRCSVPALAAVREFAQRFGWFEPSRSFPPVFFLQLYATAPLATGVSEESGQLLVADVGSDGDSGGELSIPLWRRSRGGDQRAGLVMLLAGLILPAALV